MKIWLKLIIAGVIIFFGGVVFIMTVGPTLGEVGFYGIVISAVGGILVVVGILIALTRVFNRGMRE